MAEAQVEHVTVPVTIIQSLVQLVKERDAEIRSLRQSIANMQSGRREFTPSRSPRGLSHDLPDHSPVPLSTPTPASGNRSGVVSDALASHCAAQRQVVDGVRAARNRVKEGARKGSSEDYVLESGFFRSANSSVSPIPKGLRIRDASSVDLRGLSPRRQVELYGFINRGSTPGPADYRPLYNRAAHHSKR